MARHIISDIGRAVDLVLTTGTTDLIRMAAPVPDMPAAYAPADVVVSAAVQPEGVQRALLEAQAMTLTAGELRESMGLRGRDWIPRHFNAEMPTRSPSRPCALCESSRRARPKMMKNSNSVGNLPARIAEPR